MYKKRPTSKILAALASVVVAVASMSAGYSAIVISGDMTGSGGTFEITQDITFNITGDGDAQYLDFDEWVTSGNNDGTYTAVDVAGSLSYQINGGTIQTTDNYQLIDNFTFNDGDLSPNDGFLNVTPFSVSEGDTLTIKAGSWNTTGSAGFNTSVIGTYTGNVFLADTSGNAISTITAVPEPEEWTFAAAILALGAAVWHRRRRTAQ